jgi:hypothetical protein
MEKPEPGAVGRRAMDGESMLVSRLNSNSFAPGDGMTHT